MSFELNPPNPARASVPAVPSRPVSAAVASSGAASSGAESSRGVSRGVASKAGGHCQQPQHGQQPCPLPCAFIVDDDPDVWRALARHLGPELDVHLAGTVAQAEVVLGQLERVDVAFVGLELPDGSGERILEQLARWPDAIRALISGAGGCDEDALKNRTLANIVLRKPVLPPVIEALKRAALALPNG